MKRHNNVSHPPLAAPQDSANSAAQSTSCGAAIESTASLLIHTMREADEPIAALGTALVRIGETLTRIGAPVGGEVLRDYPPAVRAGLAAIAQDVAVCIESLQFHDRLTQQLTLVGKQLAGLAANEPLPQAPPVSANKGSVELF